MTRAELEAKRAAEAASSNSSSSGDPTLAAKAAAAGATVVGSSSGTATQGKALEDLGGKEQAARQLTGTAPPLANKEADPLHGVMDDLAEGFEKVVGMLPMGFKEKIVNDPKGKLSQHETERRLSAAGEGASPPGLISFGLWLTSGTRRHDRLGQSPGRKAVPRL